MHARFKWFLAGDGIPQLLKEVAKDAPERVYASYKDRTIHIGDFREMVEGLSAKLTEMGVSNRSRVAVGLRGSVEHSAVIFALFEIGAAWVPLNVRLRGDPLEHILSDSSATHLIAEEGGDLALACASASTLAGKVGPVPEGTVGPSGVGFDEKIRLWGLAWQQSDVQLPHDVCSIMYTSGTTGAAKGVLVTDAMLQASALGGLEVAEPVEGDIFYVWEPFFHIGGAQMILFPLLADVSLAISKGFSVSRFWPEVVKTGATHIHHLGGILQMLMSQPESSIERQHRVRVSWGAGATPQIWDACERRFGLTVHECYGMTETSSVVTVNRRGPLYGVGFPLPWFELRLNSLEGGGSSGEVEVRGIYPGLVTTGYLNNIQATQRAHHDGWFRTGDIGELGKDGEVHFLGRANDSFRVRGENISAWQVESVFGGNSDIDQCAVVGVTADVGEQELLLFVTPAAGQVIEVESLAAWATARLPDFQIPRYMQVVSDLPLTPSRRVAKKQIPIDLKEAVDLKPSRRPVDVSK